MITAVAEPEATGPQPAPTVARGFRPDIEGLRAVAVALVVLYHAGVTWLPGGYVGVDVFFVLSGFLITGMLAGELRDRGTFSLAAFYARRVRRLLPASALVLVATVVLMRVVASPLWGVGFRGDAIATSLYASNLRFAAQATSYLADPAPSPLLHYWSLAIEEQFYLCWPVLLLVAGRLRVGSLARRLALVVAAVGLASLALSVVLTPRSQPYAFFLLPSRAWELAAGAGLALGIQLVRRVPRPLAAAVGWAGIAAIALAAVRFDDTTAFPGIAAVVPVAGAVLVVAAEAGPARLLTARPLQWIGRRSYSIYLWHWPLLVVPALGRATPLPATDRAALVGLALVLSIITHRLVENPLRHARSLVRSPRRSFALGALITAVAVAVAAIVGILPALDGGLPASASTTAEPTYVPNDLQPSLRAALDDQNLIMRNGCNATIPKPHAKGCVYGDPDGPSVVLFGDSHAAQWFPAFRRAADDAGWRLLVVTKSGCPAGDVPVFMRQLGRRYTECEQWRDEAFAVIAKERDPLVVITGSRNLRPMDDDTPMADALGPALERTIARLPASGRVVVLADTPRPVVNAPVCLADHLRETSACAPSRDEAFDARYRQAERDAAARTRSAYLDFGDAVCPGDPCAPIRGNLLVWRDDHHLTTAFAASLSERVRAAVGSLLRP
jgi:peptidoglycan/LPS O-acetylase OafA/YrhL